MKLAVCQGVSLRGVAGFWGDADASGTKGVLGPGSEEMGVGGERVGGSCGVALSCQKTGCLVTASRREGAGAYGCWDLV